MDVSALRVFLLRNAKPLIKFFGKISMTRPIGSISADDYIHMQKDIVPGALILTLKRGEFSNLLIPGYWSHVGIVHNKGTVVEAVGAGVKLTPLMEFLYTKDEVCLLHPTTSGDRWRMVDVADWALRMVGKPYDFMIDPSNEKFYCSELAFDAYSAATGKNIFKPRKVWGIHSISPDDFLCDAFKIKYKSKRVRIL